MVANVKRRLPQKKVFPRGRFVGGRFNLFFGSKFPDEIIDLFFVNIGTIDTFTGQDIPTLSHNMKVTVLVDTVIFTGTGWGIHIAPPDNLIV
jgi:hypothetical protein